MSIQILSSIRPKLKDVHRVLETIVMRTNQDEVYTIDVGQSLLPDRSATIGAKVTRLTEKGLTTIGQCEGPNVVAVLDAAQQLIAKAIVGVPKDAVPNPVPKPHLAADSRKNA